MALRLYDVITGTGSLRYVKRKPEVCEDCVGPDKTG